MRKLSNRGAMDVLEDVLDSLKDGEQEILTKDDLQWLRPAYNALRALAETQKPHNYGQATRWFWHQGCECELCAAQSARIVAEQAAALVRS